VSGAGHGEDVLVSVMARSEGMEEMGDMIEAMKRRVSVRSYADQPVEQGVKEKIRGLLDAHNTGPFGNRVKLALVDLSDMEQAETRHLGTYGFITGARLYVASVVGCGPGTMQDAGYCLEQVIIRITHLGLGTCWLGGTFKRASFAKRLSLSNDEVIPAISPLGYARDKRTVRERVLRRFVGADQRKPWAVLFFEGAMDRPLPREAAGEYATALECLRLAPSASNNQPWRILKSKDANVFHFFLKRTPGYAKFLRGLDLQLVDMGIAMSHFELAARETGLDGTWKVGESGFGGTEAEYVISWAGK
jgi:nitroreductase